VRERRGPSPAQICAYSACPHAFRRSLTALPEAFSGSARLSTISGPPKLPLCDPVRYFTVGVLLCVLGCQPPSPFAPPRPDPCSWKLCSNWREEIGICGFALQISSHLTRRVFGKPVPCQRARPSSRPKKRPGKKSATDSQLRVALFSRVVCCVIPSQRRASWATRRSPPALIAAGKHFRIP